MDLARPAWSAGPARVIELAELSKTFGRGRRLVVGLPPTSLSVREGEIAALVGPNGSGKTTALRIAATLIEPSRGRALVCGHDVTKHGAAVRSAIGVSFGSGRSFYLRLTAWQNLAFFGRLAGLTGAPLGERIRAASAELGIEPYLDAPARRLSRGMLARLSVARALVHAPPVLLLDEPFASLDTAGREAVVRAARSAASQGAAVLVTAQDRKDASWCDDLHSVPSR